MTNHMCLYSSVASLLCLKLSAISEDCNLSLCHLSHPWLFWIVCSVKMGALTQSWLDVSVLFKFLGNVQRHRKSQGYNFLHLMKWQLCSALTYAPGHQGLHRLLLTWGSDPLCSHPRGVPWAQNTSLLLSINPCAVRCAAVRARQLGRKGFRSLPWGEVLINSAIL